MTARESRRNNNRLGPGAHLLWLAGKSLVRKVQTKLGNFLVPACNSFSHSPTAAVQALVCARRHTFLYTPASREEAQKETDWCVGGP